MPELGTSGSVRGQVSDGLSYLDLVLSGKVSLTELYAGDTAFLTFADEAGIYVYGVEMSYIDPDTNETVVKTFSEPDRFTMPDADITLKPLCYEWIVTFDSDGGSEVEAQKVADGEKAVKPKNPTGEGLTFAGWYQVTDASGGTLADTAFDFENTAITGDITLKAVWKEEEFACVTSATASFNEKISLNFYVEVPESLAEGAYAVLTCGSDKVTVQVSDAAQLNEAGKQSCKFSYTLLAKQIEDTVNIQLFDGSGTPLLFKNEAGTNDYTEKGVDMSILRYVDYMIENGSDTMKMLAQASKDYCYAAKQKFAGGDCTISSAVNEVTLEILNDYAPVLSGTLPDGVTVDSISAMFESDNAFRLYLNFDESVNPEDLTFALDSSENTVSLQQRQDGKQYLTFTGVTSTKLGENHTFIISDGSNTYQVTVSVLSYARAVLRNSSTEKMVTLAKALYLYNQAAMKHFG